MNFSFYIAKRYFFSRKNTNVINIITAISIVGVMVGSFALIVILSVFNGLEDMVISRFNAFDPEIKITDKYDRNFVLIKKIIELKNDKDIEFLSYTLTENALIKYQDKHHPFKIKGVDKNFVKITGIDTMMVRGSFMLQKGDLSLAVIGYTVEYYLAVNIFLSSQLKIYLPKRKGKVSNLNPEAAFYKSYITPVGVYGVDKEVDDFIIIPLEFLQKTGRFKNQIDAIDIKLKDSEKTEEVKHRLQKQLGNDFKVKDRFQQHTEVYKIMKSEKIMVFLILAFILMIASFNIVGSITMLILDKEQDISILRSVGGNLKKLKEIFITEGVIITQTGLFLGLIFGVITVWLQEKYGFIKIGGNSSGTFIIDAYPVKLILSDLFFVYLTVSVIGFLATIIPVRYGFKKISKNFKDNI